MTEPEDVLTESARPDSNATQVTVADPEHRRTEDRERVADDQQVEGHITSMDDRASNSAPEGVLEAQQSKCALLRDCYVPNLIRCRLYSIHKLYDPALFNARSTKS